MFAWCLVLNSNILAYFINHKNFTKQEKNCCYFKRIKGKKRHIKHGFLVFARLQLTCYGKLLLNQEILLELKLVALSEMNVLLVCSESLYSKAIWNEKPSLENKPYGLFVLLKELIC